MQQNRALRSILLSVILLVGSLLPMFFIIPAQAASSQGETTFYFKEALGFFDDENYSDYGFYTSISSNPPTKQNDSIYPPPLFVINTSLILPFYILNADQWFSYA